MVTNIAAYHFAAVDEPDALDGRMRERAEACALLGTVLVAGEGINLLLAGTDNAIEVFLQQLGADPRLAGLERTSDVWGHSGVLRLDTGVGWLTKKKKKTYNQ